MATRPVSKETELALIKQKLDSISGKLTSLEQQLETKYAQAIELTAVRLSISELYKIMTPRDQFILVRNIVFGGCGIILTTVLGAIVALVVTR